MNNYELKQVSLLDNHELLSFKRKCLEERQTVHGSSGIMRMKDLDKWKRHIQQQRNGKYPVIYYGLVDSKSQEMVGCLSIKLKLNPYESVKGGHISYFIEPSSRRRGLGSTCLKEGILKARKKGLSNLLLTCKATNMGSQKIIIKNGGVFYSSIMVNQEEIYQYVIKVPFKR